MALNSIWMEINFVKYEMKQSMPQGNLAPTVHMTVPKNKLFAAISSSQISS